MAHLRLTADARTARCTDIFDDDDSDDERYDDDDINDYGYDEAATTTCVSRSEHTIDSHVFVEYHRLRTYVPLPPLLG